MTQEFILWTIKGMAKAPSKYGRVLTWLQAMTTAELRDLVVDVAQQPIQHADLVRYLKNLSK